jgi:hypothetical protein
VQLGFVPPVQVFSREADVMGFRLAGLAAANRDVTGLDLAGIVTVADRDVRGVQLAALVNSAAGSVTGVQIAALGNRAANGAADSAAPDARMTGAQIGLVNVGNVRGAQLGFANAASLGTGAQLGVFNWADAIDGGVQIGALNFCGNCFLPFLPIVNFRFD